LEGNWTLSLDMTFVYLLCGGAVLQTLTLLSIAATHRVETRREGLKELSANRNSVKPSRSCLKLFNHKNNDLLHIRAFWACVTGSAHP
jgi:hypothetical protein